MAYGDPLEWKKYKVQKDIAEHEKTMGWMRLLADALIKPAAITTGEILIDKARQQWNVPDYTKELKRTATETAKLQYEAEKETMPFKIKEFKATSEYQTKLAKEKTPVIKQVIAQDLKTKNAHSALLEQQAIDVSNARSTQNAALQLQTLKALLNHQMMALQYLRSVQVKAGTGMPNLNDLYKQVAELKDTINKLDPTASDYVSKKEQLTTDLLNTSTRLQELLTQKYNIPDYKAGGISIQTKEHPKLIKENKKTGQDFRQYEKAMNEYLTQTAKLSGKNFTSDKILSVINTPNFTPKSLFTAPRTNAKLYLSNLNNALKLIEDVEEQKKYATEKLNELSGTQKDILSALVDNYNQIDKASLMKIDTKNKENFDVWLKSMQIGIDKRINQVLEKIKKIKGDAQIEIKTTLLDF